MKARFVDRYALIIAQAIGKAGATDADARQLVYEKLRQSNERVIAKQSDPVVAIEMGEQFREAVARFESSARSLFEAASPAGTVSEADSSTSDGIHTSRRHSVSVFLALIAMTSALLAGVAGGFAYGVGQSKNIALIHDAKKLDRQLADLKPQIDAVAEYLDKRAKPTIEDLVGRNSQSLTEIAGKNFVDLQLVAPDLRGQAPGLPAGDAVVIRVVGKGYKILYRSSLCAAVKFLRPDLVDPRRDSLTVGCIYFGVWNDAGREL